jgi:outer membrane protein OmpA-like peptidoglycan-associated protein
MSTERHTRGGFDAALRSIGLAADPSALFGPLPVDVEAAIQRLAASYPDVLSFDAKRGMLRFASDFTFDLGSVALKSEANETLRALARILNTETALEFEARIVGHTDNVGTRAYNQGLSERRALVLRELEGRSYDEIATTLGVTGDGVRQHLHDGLAQLAKG